jgi:hypothetical protein
VNAQPDDVDFRVRRYVYEVALAHGRPPLLAETAVNLRMPLEDVREAFRRLAAGRVLVLQPESGEVLMAAPFSAAPTPFVVALPDISCFGNCIWDALGIAAMTGRDARIVTACADCGEAMEVHVAGGQIQPGEGVAHFAVPARRWWEDIVFT